MDKKRDSFTFQRYYFEAISTLKSKEKLELYDAICAYVFEEKDATLNSKKAESCFILIKHLLDEKWKRSDIASKGWSTRKSAHPHVINEMKVSSSMSSKSDDNEPIVSTDSQALRKKAQVIFVDYLQLIHETGAKDRYAAITAISIALHELAQTTGIVVVALAQLNRNPSKPGATPTNSDLRESGQIEQDADAIILLSGDNPDKYLFRLSKNKEGGIGDLPITFNKQIQRFQEYTWMD